MHEWALAESVLTAALDAAKKENLKTIKEITIQIGELQQIERDIFEFALEEIMKGQKGLLKQTTIQIRTEDSNFVCNNCHHRWTFSSMKKKLKEEEGEAIHFIPEVALVHARCPKCGSPDFEISSGRGVSILSIKGEK